jgi:hypothetical protein
MEELRRSLLVAIAGENRKPWIFREARIGRGKLAENKDGAARGFYAARIEAVGTKPGFGFVCFEFLFLQHQSKSFSVKEASQAVPRLRLGH